MKMSNLRVSSLGVLATLVKVAFVSIIAAASLAGQERSVTYVPVALNEPTPAVGKPSASFRAAIFPIEHSMQLKVITETPVGREVLIQIKDGEGQEVYRHSVRNPALYAAYLDLSALGDGIYSVRVSALTKTGFVKHHYQKTFRLHSSSHRSISPFTQNRAKQPAPPLLYRVRRQPWL
jgi:hypothetical protein